MGLNSSKDQLCEVTSQVQNDIGQVAVEGRYHRLPKKLEDDYVLGKQALGTGYNGAVMQATRKADQKKVAVKAFKLHGVENEKKAELANETHIFLRMDHPHVARLLDAYESDDQLHLVMECLEGGELFDRIRERKVFSERDAAKAAKQMLLAVNYLHEKSIVHRDLKLENFLYESKGSDFLKLIDFGFSKVWEKDTKMEVSCGTLSYVAPEVLAKSYTSQCDLWSFGVIVFILLVGYMPFSGKSESEQIKKIKRGTYTKKDEKWNKVSPLALEFVNKLIVVDPNQRLTSEQALKHDWIAKWEEGSQHFDQSVAESLCNYAKQSQFRRSCMQLMAWSLGREERAMVRDSFLELDTNNTGTITLNQLKMVLETKFHVPEEVAERVSHAMDSNEDDVIQYSEFLAAMMASRIKLHDSLVMDTFRRFDTDSSGYVTAENLKNVLGADFDPAPVMRCIDENHDGKISYDEFIGYIKSNADTHAERVLDLIDRESSADNVEESPVRLRKRDQILGFMGMGRAA